MKALRKREIFEMLCLASFIGGAQLLHRFSTTQQLVNRAKSLHAFVPKGGRMEEDRLDHFESLSERISSKIPHSHCLHRAVGLHLLLGLKGVSSTVIIGFRQGDSIQAHAWLEVKLPTKTHFLFTSSNEGFDSQWIPS